MITSNKKIYKLKDIRDKILTGLETICGPVVQTLGPRGLNALYEDKLANPTLSNDGVTIAKEVEVKESVENLIIQIIKQAAQKTNRIAGDGTTTCTLLSQTLIKEGLKMIDNGWNPMVLKKEINKVTEEVLEEVKKLTKEVKKDKKKLKFVANVASNNDEEIAEKVVELVDFAGESGAIFIESHPKEETEIKKEQGFLLSSGITFPQLINNKARGESQYKNVKVLLTDKRIYYPNEVFHILRVIGEADLKNVVIIAKDFIGQAPNVFLSNHSNEKFNICLVKAKEEELADLSAYLGCKINSEKNGDLLDEKLELKDFAIAKSVLTNVRQTLIVNEKETVEGKLRAKNLLEEIEKSKKDEDKKKLEKRLASLTNGIVTIFVGGRTQLEIKEKMFRYEDSINATRAAVKKGYVIGGGLTLFEAYKRLKIEDMEINSLFKKVCTSTLAQLAKNGGEHLENILALSKYPTGFNARTRVFEDLEKAGIIEPYLVVEQSLKNAVSVALAILTSGYIIVYDRENDETK